METKSGKSLNLPLTADAERGGFLVNTRGVHLNDLPDEFTASVHGVWGFQKFEGPAFSRAKFTANQVGNCVERCQCANRGRQDTLHLQSPDACCVSGVTVKSEQGNDLPTLWKRTKPDELEVRISTAGRVRGRVSVDVEKFGLSEPDGIPLHTYAEAGRLDHFSVHAGDSEGMLRGTRLDEVTSLELNGIHFLALNVTRANQQDELRMADGEENGRRSRGGDDGVRVGHALKTAAFCRYRRRYKRPGPRSY